jgi:hypothetical protein
MAPVLPTLIIILQVMRGQKISGSASFTITNSSVVRTVVKKFTTGSYYLMIRVFSVGNKGGLWQYD